MFRSLLATLLLASLCSATVSQFPFNDPSYNPHSDEGFFRPVDKLSSLSAVQYTTLWHPSYPKHSVRIKQNGADWCDDTVRSYTGYIDIGARHLFFWFFESRNDPKTDDVMLWINGGPGGSSALGLFTELGPCTLKDENTTVFNPYGWNEKANIFFLDQPVGVGYSYADFGEIVDNTLDASKDIAAFMRIFFENFSEFKGRPLHLAGESYGGRYLPVFASEIYDANTRAAAQGLAPVNLTSIMIGNGCTDMPRMVLSYYDIQCTPASVNPFQDVATCVRMKKALPRCEKMLKESCIDVFDEMSCTTAQNFCFAEFETPILAAARSVYDVSKPCPVEEYEKTLCIDDIDALNKFLNNATRREQLGVDPEAGEYQPISDLVQRTFRMDWDFLQPTQFYVAELLERGIKVLVYVGTYDMACNWVGNERFTLAMEWSGQTEFISEPLRDWEVDGNVAGKTRSAGGLSFLTIDGASHMAPTDKPKESLEMVKRWLDKKDF